MSNEDRMVKVAYRGYFDDGATFIDQTRQPIEFPCADGWMPPAFVDAVRDMAVGETKTVRIPAAEAYGERNKDMMQKVPVDQIPNGDQLPVGQTIYMMGQSGQPFPVRSIEDGIATFDTNHELAGQDLTFEITLVEVAE